jgi:hypothetical protein
MPRRDGLDVVGAESPDAGLGVVAVAPVGGLLIWVTLGSGRRLPSDVEEPHVAGVGLDEVLAALDVVAHEDREDLVGDGRLLDT